MHRPTWYWWHAVYFGRQQYIVAAAAVAAVCAALWAAGSFTGWRGLQTAAYVLAGCGLAFFLCSVTGLYCMYGPPSLQYYRRLLALGGVQGTAQIADVHVGTYRSTWNYARLLPQAQIHSVDVWDDTIEGERAIAEVRRLEAPTGQKYDRITLHRGRFDFIPLADGSLDAVSLGFGIHEVPAASLEPLLREVVRILRPGGKLLMHERGWSVANFLVFGPAMFHFTRQRDWRALLKRHFGNVRPERVLGFVDLFVCEKVGPEAGGP